MLPTTRRREVVKQRPLDAGRPAGNGPNLPDVPGRLPVTLEHERGQRRGALAHLVLPRPPPSLDERRQLTDQGTTRGSPFFDRSRRSTIRPPARSTSDHVSRRTSPWR